MTSLIPYLTPTELALSLGVALLAGVVKGVVGFAMPMIFVSLLGMIIRPDLALAGLLLPTLLSNGMLAFRQGRAAALQTLRDQRRFLAAMLICLLLSSQLVLVVPQAALLVMIGLPVTLFSAVQIAGWRPRAEPLQRPGAELAIGGFAGFIGGFSGIWGPPTVMYLTALGTEKRAQMRIQGVIYGTGAIALVLAHSVSGVLDTETLPFSAALVAPALAGTWLGGRLQERVNQRTFHRLTLIVLLVAGLNLVRRGLLA